MPSPIIQIIALGSPFGADRLAWHALEQLQQSGFAERYLPGQIQLQACPSPAQLPAMVIPGTKLVLIDALEGMEQGEIQQLTLAQLEQEQDYASSHGLTLATVLPLMEQLYGGVENTTIIGIAMGNATVSRLSDQAWEQLEQQLERTVRGFAG